jgi:hypothetical protein
MHLVLVSTPFSSRRLLRSRPFVGAGDYDQIATVDWKLVIVDEFHEFKNGKSQGYMRISDIRDDSGCPVVGMT